MLSFRTMRFTSGLRVYYGDFPEESGASIQFDFPYHETYPVKELPKFSHLRCQFPPLHIYRYTS